MTAAETKYRNSIHNFELIRATYSRIASEHPDWPVKDIIDATYKAVHELAPSGAFMLLKGRRVAYKRPTIVVAVHGRWAAGTGESAGLIRLAPSLVPEKANTVAPITQADYSAALELLTEGLTELLDIARRIDAKLNGVAEATATKRQLASLNERLAQLAGAFYRSGTGAMRSEMAGLSWVTR